MLETVKELVLGWKLRKSMNVTPTLLMSTIWKETHISVLLRVKFTIVHIDRAGWLCVLFRENLTRFSL